MKTCVVSKFENENENVIGGAQKRNDFKLGGGGPGGGGYISPQYL